jgi:hypothetical protein
VEPIVAPAPPKSAFNKNRRVSDLLQSQLKHFQHVVHKQGMQIDPALARDLATEAGAARYIATITREIRAQSKPAQPQSSPIALVRPAPGAAPQPGTIQKLAASAPPSSTPSQPRPAAKKSKKSAAKRPKR